MEDETLVLTEEEERKISEGEAAATLLDSPVFLMAIERIRADCAEKILTSPPEQSVVREHLYNLSRGLSAVTEELAIIASLGQSTFENAQRETQPADEVQAEPDPASDY